MTDYRPKDNIRLLFHVWLDELETTFLEQERKPELAPRVALDNQWKVPEPVLERWFVWRVRAFLEEHPR